MAKTDNTNWLNYATLCVAIISLFVAFKSCSESKKSNEISEQALKKSRESNQISQESNEIARAALDHSKKSFILENRPYLVLQPIKNVGKGFFIEFMFNKEGYDLKAFFEVYNAGKTPAKDIAIKGYMFRGFIKDDMVFSEKPLSINASTISLGPGEKKIINFHVPLEYIPKGENVSKQESPGIIVAQNIEFRITLSMFYSSDIDESMRFKTTVIYGFPNFREAKLLATSD